MWNILEFFRKAYSTEFLESSRVFEKSFYIIYQGYSTILLKILEHSRKYRKIQEISGKTSRCFMNINDIFKKMTSWSFWKLLEFPRSFEFNNFFNVFTYHTLLRRCCPHTSRGIRERATLKTTRAHTKMWHTSVNLKFTAHTNKFYFRYNPFLAGPSYRLSCDHWRSQEKQSAVNRRNDHSAIALIYLYFSLFEGEFFL